MKTTDHQHPWVRLITAARGTPGLGEALAPYGFATRVVAQAFSAERIVGSLVERFALRAVGVAGLLALLSVAANYSVLASAEMRSSNDEALSVEEPALVLLGD